MGLKRGPIADADAETLPGVRYSILRVSQVSALGVCAWNVIQLIGERDSDILIWRVLFIVLAVAFLYDSGVPAARGVTKIGYMAGGLLLSLMTLFGALAAGGGP